jgi:hypothetical protein
LPTILQGSALGCTRPPPAATQAGRGRTGR